MYRKVILIILIALLTFSPTTLAADNSTNQMTVLTLEKSLELAYANSKTLTAAKQEVTLAKEEVRKAEAAFLPSVEYNLAFTQVFDPNVENSNGGITAKWNLYTANSLELQLKIAKAQLDAAINEEQQTKEQLTYDVKSAYYRLWVAEEKLTVAKNSYDNIVQHVEKVNKQYKVGTASKFNLLEAEVERENLKPQIIKAENGVAFAKLSFATLIGFDHNLAFTVEHKTNDVKLQSVKEPATELVARALTNRTELKKVKIDAVLVNYDIQLKESQYKPLVALAGNYGFQNKEFSPDTWDPRFSLTLGIQGYFYKPTVKPEVDATKVKLELINTKENGLKDQINLEVQQSLQSINESIETAKANQASIELAKERLRMTQARYDAGMSTTMEVMDAQLALDKALTGYYEGIADYLTANAKLDLVTGVNQ